MSYTVGPFTIATTPQTFAKPIGIVNGWVEIINESAYTLQVGTGGATSNLTIPAWFQDSIVLNQSIQQITIVGIDVAPNFVAGAPSQSIFLNWLDSTTDLGPPTPGGLVRQTQTYQANLPGNPLIVTPSNTSPISETMNIPAGMTGVALMIWGNGPTDQIEDVLCELTIGFGQVQTLNLPGPFTTDTILYAFNPQPQETQFYQVPSQLEIVAQAVPGNSFNVEITPVFLPPGGISVAEIINTVNNPVQVTAVLAPPQYWQVPTKFFGTFAKEPNVFTTVVTPPAGEQIYLFNVSAKSATAGATCYFGSNGVQISPSQDDFNCMGLALGVGKTLQVVGDGTNFATFIALYSVGA